MSAPTSTAPPPPPSRRRWLPLLGLAALIPPGLLLLGQGLWWLGDHDVFARVLRPLGESYLGTFVISSSALACPLAAGLCGSRMRQDGRPGRMSDFLMTGGILATFALIMARPS